MSRSDFGAKAEIISRLTDPQQLTAMLRDPQYAGFTSVIIARLTEINQMKQGAQGQQPQAPTVAQQAVQGQAPPPQPPQAAPQQPPGMSRGGIVAFKQGGEVRKFGEGGQPSKLARWYGEDQTPFERLVAWTKSHPQGLVGKTYPADAPTPELLTPTQGGRVAPTESGTISAGAPQQAGDTRTGLRSAQPQPQPQPQPPTTFTDDKQYTQAGINSLSGSSGSGGLNPYGDRPLGTYVKEQEALYPEDPDQKAARAELKSNKANNIDFALMNAGLGMAAGTSQNFLQNVAGGLGGGLRSYTEAQKEQQGTARELSKDEQARRFHMLNQAIAQRQQDRSLDRADKMNAKNLAAAGIKDQQEWGRVLNQAKYLRQVAVAKDPNAPTSLEQYIPQGRENLTTSYGLGQDRIAAQREQLFDKWLKDQAAVDPKAAEWAPEYARAKYDALHPGAGIASLNPTGPHRGALT